MTLPASSTVLAQMNADEFVNELVPQAPAAMGSGRAVPLPSLPSIPAPVITPGWLRQPVRSFVESLPFAARLPVEMAPSVLGGLATAPFGAPILGGAAGELLGQNLFHE